jgi:hypothetical protein
MRATEFIIEKRRIKQNEQAPTWANPNQPQQQPDPNTDPTTPTPAPPQGIDARKALNALRTLGQAYYTFKDKDLGGMARQEMIDMIKNKARNEPNK